MWSIEDIAFEIIDDLTSDPVVRVVVSTPDGTLKFMAEPEQQGSTLILHTTHVQDARANAMGHGNLMVLAQALMERMGFDGLVVEGAIRATGANPGRRPRPLRFTRRVRPAPAPGPGAP
jgi:hypothetical protein